MATPVRFETLLSDVQTKVLRKKILRPSWRLLIGLLVMVDAIRTLFQGTRPIDWIIFVVEFLVLCLIGWEFYWNFKDRYAARKDERDMKVKLGSLTPEERGGLDVILKGGQPQVHIAIALTNKIYGLVIRMPHGLEIASDHRAFITRWLGKI